MAGADPDFVLRYLAEVEALAEEVMANRQQIVDLNQKRNQNREALRALSKELDSADQELLEEEIGKLQQELKVKVSNLMEAQDAKDLDQLSRNDITHIVSIHESPQPFIPGITYLRIVLPDTPEANIKKHFKKCIRFIHSCRLQGGTCLVHCLAGISRSTTIVLAYLMVVTQLGWLEALEAVKAVRPVANPNLGFRRQLEEFGRSRSVQKIRQKLQPPPRGTLFNDREALRGLLPSGRKLEPPSPERPWPAPGPKTTGSGVKHMDSFLIRVKDTFSCLPSCLK
ncbi:dual specificity protein phosphatase 15-like isoform X3 [Ahaetulla prasina]|uniref:dual specificity protein phosphatase 15-like isoform X3 n=1 Tax=Ahaetulla prasina TaxID=499056 RepID=UPI002647BB4A|nr:dual specificity protein phosphatase 15-like isoform X3 [Ahaetulla prasina]